MFRLDAEHVLRPVRAGDGAAMARAYLTNREHLAPWEPVRDDDFFTGQHQELLVRQSVADADAGRSIRFIIESDDGEIRGRVNLNNIVRGAFWSTDLGYWIDSTRQGRGLATGAVGRATTYAKDELRLHRMQAATLLHNTGSQRVLATNGFVRIGVAARYLEIGGSWQDHILFQRILDCDLAPAADQR